MFFTSPVKVKRRNDQYDMSVRQWKKKKHESRREANLPNTIWTLYPLSYESNRRARSLNLVHIWHGSCILPGLAMSIKPCIMINEQRRWILSSAMKFKKTKYKWHERGTMLFLLTRSLDHTLLQIHKKLFLTPCHVELERNNCSPYHLGSSPDTQDFSVYCLPRNHIVLYLQNRSQN